MNANHTIGDPGELAACYAVGAMTPHETEAFEQHLASGCAACLAEVRANAELVTELYGAVTPAAVPPGVREALLNRITKHVAGASHAGADGHSHSAEGTQVWRAWQPPRVQGGLFTQRADEGAWEPTDIKGIEVKRLFVDPERDQITMLVRMAAGTAYPKHIHRGPEECFVISGDLRVGERVMGAGDYQRAEPDSLHGVQSTERGCTLLIVSSLSDELV